MAYETLIQKFLAKHPELRRTEWLNARNPLAGHCYVASEVYFHLNGGRSKWTAHVLRHEGTSHWFLKGHDGKIVDLTAKQFRTRVPYEKGQPIGFLTKGPSKRARIVIEAIRR